MRCTWKLWVVVLFAMGFAGCRSDRRVLESPGTVEKQRLNATMFDPYADVDTGPEVVGSRPRDFQEPLSEPARSRLFQSLRHSFD